MLPDDLKARKQPLARVSLLLSHWAYQLWCHYPLRRSSCSQFSCVVLVQEEPLYSELASEGFV